MILETTTDVPAPLTAVLEVSGAVLSWVVDDPAAPAAITFTDLTRADWLWRLVGESAHAALLSGQPLTGALTLAAEPAAALRRLALGHWLRRWWPASRHDGIVALDPALLDAEIAVLTAAADGFFTDDTLDSDVAALLAPHAVGLAVAAHGGDPRVTDLVDACVELADDAGLDGWSEIIVESTAEGVAETPGRRDDYALAAGPTTTGRDGVALASGTASVCWDAVPPHVFDAAENTVAWTVAAVDDRVRATVTVALVPDASAAGFPVRLHSDRIDGTGVLDAAGRAVFDLVDDAAAVTETSAWNHGWGATTVTIGADSSETAATRDRVRALARARLARPGSDAFLAEALAAEADY
jgi:hypothetical protein